jgi:hypothetical protein
VAKVFYRTVTNVLSTAATFYGTATIDQPSEKLLKVVSISPASFTLGAGESQLLRFEVLAQRGAYGADWMYGSIIWHSNKGTSARIPLAAKVSLLDAPLEVSPTIATVKKGLLFGYTINPGVTGQLKLTHTGLAPAMMISGTISNDQWIAANVTIPVGTTYARFAVFQADFKGANNTPLRFTQNVDLYVGDFNATTSGFSESNSPDEQVSFVSPTPGTYEVAVHGVNVAANVSLYVSVWLLDSTPLGNMQHRKSMAVTAGTKAVVGLHISKDLTFSNNATTRKPPRRYLGRITTWSGNNQGDATVVAIVA